MRSDWEMILGWRMLLLQQCDETWKTQQPSERQGCQMQSRRENRVTLDLDGLTGCREHVGFMRFRND